MRSIPSDLPSVKCTKCKQPYPLTAEFFPNDKKKKNGFASRCKQCANVYDKQYREANKEKLKDMERQRNRHDIRRVEQRQKREKTEEYKLYQQQYRAIHKQEIAEQRRQYYLANADEIRERDRKRNRNRDSAVRKAYTQKRRARAKLVEGTLTSLEIQTKLRKQHYKCYYCQEKLDKINGKYVYHLEHTVPISRTEYSPRHDINYVVLSCPTCNMRKNNKLPSEWPEGGRLL